MDRKSQNLQSKHRYVYGGSPDHLPLPVEDSCGDLHDNTQNHSLPSQQRLLPQHFRPHQSSPSASEGTTAVTLIRPQYLLPQHWHSICASPRESDIRLCSRVGGKKMFIGWDWLAYWSWVKPFVGMPMFQGVCFARDPSSGGGQVTGY